MNKLEKDFFVEFHKKITQSVPVKNIVLKTSLDTKKAWFYIARWGVRGLYDYGFDLTLGSLTDQGKKLAKTLERKEQNDKRCKDFF